MISGSATKKVMPVAGARQATASRVNRLLPAVLALAALFAGLLVALEAPAPIRLPVVLLFLAMGPGLSIINLFGIDDITQKLTLSLGLSVALDTIVAGLVLYAGLWSPRGIMLVLVLITLTGAVAQLRYTPQRLGFIDPAAPETSLEALQPIAITSGPEEAMIPVSAVSNDPPSATPVSESPPHSPDAAKVPIARGASPNRLARAIVFIGLVGGCIMVIARTSHSIARER